MADVVLRLQQMGYIGGGGGGPQVAAGGTQVLCSGGGTQVAAAASRAAEVVYSDVQGSGRGPQRCTGQWRVHKWCAGRRWGSTDEDGGGTQGVHRAVEGR